MSNERLVLTDINRRDPLGRYFLANNIDFDFLPVAPEVPMVDMIADRIKNKHDVVLVLTFGYFIDENGKSREAVLERLFREVSQYNDFSELRRSITLIIYKNGDLLERLHDKRRDYPDFCKWLNSLRPIILTDGRPGESLKNSYIDCEFVELQTPNVQMDNVMPEFSTLKRHDPKTDYLCLMRDQDRKPARRWLNEKILACGLQRNMIYKFNRKENPFEDLESQFPQKLVDGFGWKEIVPPVAYYNQTNAELVVETMCHDNDDTFYLTEKTTKPITMMHPFMVLSNKGFLKNLCDLGFRTFNEYFDESYDREPQIDKRIQIITQNLMDLRGRTYEIYRDSQKIRQHNLLNLQHLSGEYYTNFWKNMDNVWKNI